MHEHKEAITSIISDYILWQRVSNAMHKIVNAFEADEAHEWEPESQYGGYCNAYFIMRIHNDDELTMELYDPVANAVLADGKPKALAIMVFDRWEAIIKRHFKHK